MVEKYRYMRKGNSNRIRRKDNFRENAEKVVKDICNLNKHFMNKYWVDLLIIVHKDCHLITETTHGAFNLYLFGN